MSGLDVDLLGLDPRHPLRIGLRGIGTDLSYLDAYLPEGARVDAADPDIVVTRWTGAPPTTVAAPPSAEIVEHFPGRRLARWTDPGAIEVRYLDAPVAMRGSFATPGRTLPDRIEVWRGPGGDRVEGLILRVYRDLVQHHLYRAGCVVLHAGAVARDGVAVAFVGDKGAGKSAWVIRALRHGWSLLANDRVFVHPATRRVMGFPIAAMISRPTLQHLPATLQRAITTDRIARRDHRIAGYPKIGLTPGELARAFGVDRPAGATLARIVLLSAGRATATVGANLYTPTDPTYAWNVLCRRPPIREGDLARVMGSGIAFEAIAPQWDQFDATFHQTFPLTVER